MRLFKKKINVAQRDSMTSYQRRKREIAYLNQRIRDLIQKAEFFQKAIWEARKSTGEYLGIEPFSDLEGDEERPVVSDKDGLLSLIRRLPIHWQHPGIEGDDFLTPENCSEESI